MLITVGAVGRCKGPCCIMANFVEGSVCFGWCACGSKRDTILSGEVTWVRLGRMCVLFHFVEGFCGIKLD